MSTSTAASTQKPDLLRVADRVKAELRQIISDWSAGSPEQTIKVVPLESLQSLARFDRSSVLRILQQLEGYVGAALTAEDQLRTGAKDPVIRWSYKLHPRLNGSVEVLMRSDTLEQKPLDLLSDELVRLTLQVAGPFDVDSSFSFVVPVCVQERFELMSPYNKKVFNERLTRKLAQRGMSIEGKLMDAEVEIRRNQNR
jgi:hypothetical protein